MDIEIFRKIRKEGGRALIVGGWVRDKLMDVYSKDIDVEIFGIPESELGAKLQRCFGDSVSKDTTEVGKSFSVFKMGMYDFSLPRTEKKTGSGHTGFSTVPDHNLDFKTASMRRDFTINSIGYDPIKSEYYDEWGGIDDIRKLILRHTSSAFSEDPLRVMRAFQFISRFKLFPHKETVDLCRTLRSEFHTISKERILEEFKKWAMGDHPACGLSFLKRSSWIEEMPILSNMVRCPQDPVVHPEGDVFSHTALICQYIADKFDFEGKDRFTLMMAGLLSNCGKPNSVVYEGSDPIRGRVTFPEYHLVSAILADNFLHELKCDHDTIHKITEVLTNQMEPFVQPNSAAKARKLLHRQNRHKSMKFLWPLLEANNSSRPPHPCGMPRLASELIDLCKDELLINPSCSCLIFGRDLIERGYKQGKDLGLEKQRLYDLQVKFGYARKELLSMIKEPS